MPDIARKPGFFRTIPVRSTGALQIFDPGVVLRTLNSPFFKKECDDQAVRGD